uniref:Uncharacterized protein n=1 Tax=Cannabis sativa TaxID=3483 RepID=A0A803Q1H1_CANSA
MNELIEERESLQKLLYDYDENIKTLAKDLAQEKEARAKDKETYESVGAKILYEFEKAKPESNFGYLKPEEHEALIGMCQSLKAEEDANEVEEEK